MDIRKSMVGGEKNTEKWQSSCKRRWKQMKRDKLLLLQGRPLNWRKKERKTYVGAAKENKREETRQKNK